MIDDFLLLALKYISTDERSILDWIIYTSKDPFIFLFWTGANLMFQIHDSQGSTWQFMYFVSMVVLGAFFVMNLILGVLSGWVADKT